MKMEAKEKQDELIELLGVHFEKYYNLSPLASRIKSYLIVNNKEEGVTFDELVHELSASKSSVSTNLNVLLSMETIFYCTKKGDRKKYFKISPFSLRLKKYMDNINDEMFIIEKLENFKEENCAKEKDKLVLHNIKMYKEHMAQMKKLLQVTMDKLIEVENKTN